MRLDCDARDFDPNRAMAEPSPLGTVVVEPFGYVVLLEMMIPPKTGVTVAGTFDFNLTNSGDTIILTCAGAEVDRVAMIRGLAFQMSLRWYRSRVMGWCGVMISLLHGADKPI